MQWFDEYVPRIERGNWLYNLICTFLGKRKTKMTYKEIYAFIYELNKGKLGEADAKTAAIIRVVEIYKHLHNGEEPKEKEYDDE